jgi:hypothetical protein
MKRPPIPLYGFVEGDSLGLLVLADTGQTVDALARQLLQAAAPRVAPFTPARVRCGDRLLDGRDSLSACGLKGLERVDVTRGSAPDGV